jgi:hypothetical protein
MTVIKDAANEALARSRDAAARVGQTASRVGKVAGSAAVKAAKAGAAAAAMAGSAEVRKGWKESDPELAKKRRRRKIADVVAGAAALTAVGVAISRNKSAAKKAISKGKASLNGAAGASTDRLKKAVAKARKRVAH